LILDEELPPEVRKHLADTISGLLIGSIKPPRGRPRKRGLWLERREIARRVWDTKKSKGWKKVGSAIEDVAKQLKCSPRTVYKCWAEFDPAGYELKLEKLKYDAMLDATYEARAEGRA
jgi:hypothetical protein